MKIFILSTFLIFHLSVFAQQTKSFQPGQQSPNANIEDFAWIQGSWQGEALGGVVEEIWSAPNGKSMMGSFRLIKDDEVQFYELCVMRESNESVILELKHFDSELKGWETKDEKVSFPLISYTDSKAFFDGFTIEKIDGNHLNMYVLIQEGDEPVEIQFSYTRQ